MSGSVSTYDGVPSTSSDPEPGGVRPSRAVRWLLGVAAAVIALCAGGAAGALAGAAGSQPSGPHGPPEIPDGFPSLSRSYLPVVTVAELEGWIADNGYRCESDDLPRAWSGAEQVVYCRPPSDHGVSATVSIEHDGGRDVRGVRATCLRGPVTPEGYCPDMFSLVADAVFANRPELREDARSWTLEHADNDAEIIIGEVAIRVDLQQGSLLLLTAG